MKNLVNTLFFILVGVALFSLAGFLLPYLFYEYVDWREYYRIEVPVTTTQNQYNLCDTVTIPVARRSEIDTQGEVFVELIKVEDGDINIEFETHKFDILIEKGIQTRLIKQVVPCDATPGFFYVRGRVTFKVKGAHHSHEFITNTFEVK